jgi:hypothetical protein
MRLYRYEVKIAEMIDGRDVDKRLRKLMNEGWRIAWVHRGMLVNMPLYTRQRRRWFWQSPDSFPRIWGRVRS